MQREIQLTADGSSTIAVPEMNVTYHSHHGAIAESRHVYIDAGLQQIINTPGHSPVNILEIGFGTGLNVLLTLKESIEQQKHIYYIAIEMFPLIETEIAGTNHGNLLSMQKEFELIHAVPWKKDVPINKLFTLRKINISLLQLNIGQQFDCIYFDCFSPTVQPELWTQEVFENLYSMLAAGGILVTYCSQSEVRRKMTVAGFTVTKIPGPYGKREMVRAGKH
jgi:tRNA U34 5-methylaminomethyl-2-thiouridine-forming methyltransferase MnmC